MPTPYPKQATSSLPSHPAIRQERSFNINESLFVAGEEWRVFNSCSREVKDVFEALYLVEMEIVNQQNGNHFDVTVSIYWEDYPHLNFKPPKEALFGLARNLLQDHLTENRYPPRFSGCKYGIPLRWPELDEYDGTI
jgi:hypothetical protein